jgi:cation diffusion facilitator CzcD-associated flavoprotein CzcO
MGAIVIGAGPAGLAVAACLRREGISTRVIERAFNVGSSWRGHYDSLHLHTSRRCSGLPMMRMPRHLPQFPSRDDVVAYLEAYAAKFVPDIVFDSAVQGVSDKDGIWRVLHDKGEDCAPTVVVATGLNGTPRRPTWPGIESFDGRILHSRDYRNPGDLLGENILVVGFGNTGADICLELAEAGLNVHASVRGPVNIMPIRLLGVPTTSLGLLPKVLGYKLADRLTAPILRSAIGRPEDYGMLSADKGPVAQIVEDGKIPIIDHGALSAIKAGKIGIWPGVAKFDGNDVCFEDESRHHYDGVILATGYEVDLRPIFGSSRDVLTPEGAPLTSGGATQAPGLFFASYVAATEGQLRQTGFEAKTIAKLAVRYLR